MKTAHQYLAGLCLVLAVSAICYTFSPYIGYKTVALILLVTVSITAMFFDMIPVLVIAVVSAFIWDFFFIPPYFTITVGDRDDALMLLMYFIIVLVNASLTLKIRQVEKIARKREAKEQTLKLYGTLLNSLSHELRTPISTVIGATDNLQSDAGNLSEENRRELLSEISKAGLRLNREVENLLNMSRLESGFLTLKKDWCDIHELIYGVLNRLKDVTANHPVNVQAKDTLPLFRIDFGLMEQVIYNLVYNAAVYIPKYSVITIRALVRNEQLVLVVEDTGNGFAPGEIDRAFEKFYRSSSAPTGGTGLGLSIAKGFVEAHDGTIILENIPEGGARFTISIPAEMSYINNLKNE